MIMWLARPAVGRIVSVILGATAAFWISAGIRTGSAQTPAPTAQAPAPATSAQPARQGQAGAPAGQRGPAVDQGPVRDANNAVIGFTKLAEIPGTPWRIHDAARPHPRVVTPGATPGAPPADAIVLFDGKDLSKWAKVQNGQVSDAAWPVRDGYFETGAGSGSIVTREKFGDVQLHVEFATPSPARGYSQDRGNSGVIFMGRYEVQVLDSYENVTYADGQAAAIYGEYPPLVNVARKPGEWQTYDIVFEAPKFNGTTVTSPAYVTVFWNGVLVQHRRPVMGPTSATATVHQYTPHEPELPLTLQDHNHPVHYRNIWIRRLAGYDQPEQK
jgi:3-keto-disaccharide hydrolase